MTLLSAGDIAQCFNNVTGDPSKGQHPGAGAIATANLIRTLLPVDDLIAQGDLAYDDGTAAEFKDCYDPTWGAFKAFTHPAPGTTSTTRRAPRRTSPTGATAPVRRARATTPTSSARGTWCR